MRGIEEAGLDASRWPDVLAEISAHAGAGGALLLSTDKRFPGPPVSPGMEEITGAYFRDGWADRDERYRGMPTLLRRGVSVDQDFVGLDEIERSPYYQDLHGRFGYRWSACVGFNASGDLWCLALQRTIAQGPFEPDETRELTAVWRALTDAATLSRRLGFARVLGAVDGLDHVEQAAIALDGRGRALAHNKAAEAEFGILFEKRLGGLSFFDRRSQARFDSLLAGAVAEPYAPLDAPAAATVFDRRGRAARLRAVVLRDWGRYAFTGARVLLLVNRSTQASAPPPMWTFGLTPAEARLAGELVAGVSLAEAASKAGIAYETARSQLKAIFAKTGVRRQAELVALLSGGKS